MSKFGVVDGKGWDWSLDDKQKIAVAWGFGFITLLAWLLYSTPATINVGVLFTKDITIIGIPHSGIVLGVVGALVVSMLELAFMYLTIWKSFYFIIAVLITGFISVMGTVLFIDIGNQNQFNKINSIKAQVTIIKEIRRSIKDDSLYIANTIPELKGQHRRQYGYIKEYVYKRERQAIQRKQANNELLQQESARLIALRKENGAIITFGNAESGDSKGANISFAIFIEAALISSGLISIGIQRSSPFVENKINKENDDIKLILTENGLKAVDDQYFPVEISNNDQVKIKKTTGKNVNQIGFKIGERVNQKDEKLSTKVSTKSNKSVNQNEGNLSTNLVDKNNTNDVNVDRFLSTKLSTNSGQSVNQNEGNLSTKLSTKVSTNLEKRLTNLVDTFGRKSKPIIIELIEQGYSDQTEIRQLTSKILDRKISRQYVNKIIKEIREAQ